MEHPEGPLQQTSEKVEGTGVFQRFDIPKSSDINVNALNVQLDDATDINAARMNNEKIGRQSIFNLAGQRVNTPNHGLYIVNGKKTIIK